MSDVVENRETERLKHKKKKKYSSTCVEKHDAIFILPIARRKRDTGSDPLFLHEEKGGGREEEVRRERVSSVNK